MGKSAALTLSTMQPSGCHHLHGWRDDIRGGGGHSESEPRTRNIRESPSGWDVRAQFIEVRTFCPLPYRPLADHSNRMCSFLDQIATAPFPPSYGVPPLESSAAASASADRPALNLQLGGINVSVGGVGGTGVYRSTGGGDGVVSVQADGLKDGVRDLWGKVRQGVERFG